MVKTECKNCGKAITPHKGFWGGWVHVEDHLEVCDAVPTLDDEMPLTAQPVFLSGERSKPRVA